VLIEVAMMGPLVGAMFVFVSARALVRWTPVIAGSVVLNTWLGSAFAKTGLNPARTMGPSLMAGQWQEWWVYFARWRAGVRDCPRSTR
jgi:aquaporin Z